MRNRKKILKDLVLLKGNIKILEKELSKYHWDIEKSLITIDTVYFINVLKRYINNEIDFNILSNWANAIECREDLDFSNEIIQEIIYELANFEINGEITKERLNEIISQLES
jgi:hypothetical protein